ncbi:MAG: hypothetical protein ACOCU7_05115 [Tangfeifania sp.]
MKRFPISLIVLFCLITTCKKEKTDYRLPYTGNFEITTFKNVVSMCYDSSASCIDGWETIRMDTTTMNSFIEAVNKNRLDIEFGTNEIGRYNDSIYKEIFYPIISSEGEMTLPEYPRGGHNFFEGFFFGYDTLIMNFHYGFGIGGYRQHEITGIRKQ